MATPTKLLKTCAATGIQIVPDRQYNQPKTQPKTTAPGICAGLPCTAPNIKAESKMAIHGRILCRIRCRWIPIRNTSSSVTGPTKTIAKTPQGLYTSVANTSLFKSSNVKVSSNKFTINMTGNIHKTTPTYTGHFICPKRQLLRSVHLNKVITAHTTAPFNNREIPKADGEVANAFTSKRPS